MIEEVLLNLVIERDDAVTIKGSGIQEAPQLYRGLYIEPGLRRQEEFERWNSREDVRQEKPFESGASLKTLEGCYLDREVNTAARDME